MRKLAILFSALLLVSFSRAQKTETVYLDAADSSSSLYIVVFPPKLPYTGYLFLVPGMFQKPGDVLLQTELPRIAARQGILTIIPTFKTGIASFGMDTATQASFLELLGAVRSRHRLTDQKFYVGGFSIGGTCALKYAELAIRNKYPVQPAAVFAIDAPLDFERMYRTMVREMRFPGTGKEILEENQYMLRRFNKEFGGTPDEALPNYYRLSPYSFSDTTQQAIQPLASLPIRLYTEPDVLWALNEGVDYSGMNAFDFAALTNELRRMGNKKVTLIPTADKGYRKPDHKRHPHSWSIAEPNDLVKWLLAQ
ncbi:MAG TPA: hypothetical protein VHK69_21135 [Chitinophagaceae bacterium]|jgi:hypothetical protein|nr:hypothetical protein [Chitinophagaceae bacterium]